MPSSKKPLMIAHRGERILSPENTIRACHLALAQGATALEVDVRICRSGEVVLFHDYLMYRHFGKFNRIECRDISELKTLEYQKESYQYGDRMCTLDEFLEEFRDTVPINLDAKSQTPFNSKFAHSLINLLNRHEILDQVWVSSFNPLLIRRMKKIDPSIRTGFLFQDPLQFYRFIDIFLHSDAWHPHHKNLSRWLVKKARRLNKKMYTWTVNRPEVLERVMKYDIDGIITDVFFRNRELSDDKE